MFTGLVEATATVLRAQPAGATIRLEVEKPTAFDDVKIGDSIAVNGACLTVVALGDSLSFDVVSETAQRSTIAQFKSGRRVNLERSLAVGDRLGGHFVQGHIDGTATLAAVSPEGVFTFNAPNELTDQILLKGSVALDGVSLTVASVKAGEFSLAIIPHTLTTTTLGDLRPGDHVNIETDVLGKWIMRLLDVGSAKGITPEFLRDHGFA